MLVLTILLAFILSAIVGSNNLPSFTATLHGSGLVKRKGRVILVIFGFLLGATIEGYKLLKFKEMMPILPNETLNLAFCLIIIIFLASTILELPIPFSQTLVAYLIGASLTLSLPINYGYVMLIFLSWILTPPISLLSSSVIVKIFELWMGKAKVWRRALLCKVLLIIASIYTAYVFGINTLGLLSAILSSYVGSFLEATFLILSGASIGVILTRERGMRRVSRGIYQIGYLSGASSQIGGALVIEIFTQLGVPISVTQSIVSGIIGSALTKRVKMINWKNFAVILAQWFLTPLIGFFIGFLFT